MGEKESRLRQWRLVIDTNLIVSALLFSGVTSKIIEHFGVGTFKPIISKDILTEYIAVLAYPKFALEEAEINFLISNYILAYAEMTKPKKLEIPGSLDQEDNKFLECAVAGRADALLSGDQHLLKLKNFQGIPIVSFQQFSGGI